MMRPCAILVVAAMAALTTGCGGAAETPDHSAATADATAEATESTGEATTDEEPAPKPDSSAPYPSLGCDVLPRCAPDHAATMLEECPESRLDAEGREVRRRLDRLLARSNAIDLHNEQAYEAQEALIAAVHQLEAECR